MQHLKVSGAVRPLKWSLGVKWLTDLDVFHCEDLGLMGHETVLGGHFEGLLCRHFLWSRGSRIIECGSTMFARNVRNHSPSDTASHPRRPES